MNDVYITLGGIDILFLMRKNIRTYIFNVGSFLHPTARSGLGVSIYNIPKPRLMPHS